MNSVTRINPRTMTSERTLSYLEVECGFFSISNRDAGYLNNRNKNNRLEVNGTVKRNRFVEYAGLTFLRTQSGLLLPVDFGENQPSLGINIIMLESQQKKKAQSEMIKPTSK